MEKCEEYGDASEGGDTIVAMDAIIKLNCLWTILY